MRHVVRLSRAQQVRVPTFSSQAYLWRELGNNNGYESVTLEYSMRALQFIHHTCVHTDTLRDQTSVTFMRYLGGGCAKQVPPETQAGVSKLVEW